MIEVGKLGRTMGVNGGIRLHVSSDFPEIFYQDIDFFIQREGLLNDYLKVRIKSFENGIVSFFGFESLESAKSLRNARLSVALEDTRKFCSLKEGEAFWFDVIGCEIIEEGECLGVVKEIERIVNLDYLIIDTYADTHARGKKLPKTFMLPYIPRYILKASFEEKKIFTQGAREIWLAS